MEWLDFGHKFADRCGHGENSDDLNERCPVFLQWLDCVHQLQRQFPCSFEFNEAFLVSLDLMILHFGNHLHLGDVDTIVSGPFSPKLCIFTFNLEGLLYLKAIAVNRHFIFHSINLGALAFPL